MVGGGATRVDNSRLCLLACWAVLCEASYLNIRHINYWSPSHIQGDWGDIWPYSRLMHGYLTLLVKNSGSSQSRHEVDCIPYMQLKSFFWRQVEMPSSDVTYRTSMPQRLLLTPSP